MLPRRELIAGHTQPPQAGLYVTRQRGVAAERTSHLLQDLADLDQHQLLLAHHPKKRTGRRPYRAIASRVSTKALTARSRSDFEWAADTWVLIRALPWGTTGYENPTT